MERNKKNPPLFLLLVLPFFCTIKEISCSGPSNEDLTCYTDYNYTITCVWNSTYMSDQADTVCTVSAEKMRGYALNRSCKLKPVDISRPTLKKCSMIFHEYAFQSFTEFAIELNCNGKKQISFFYKPVKHIKLNPPPKPVINYTTVSWFPQVTKHDRLLESYRSELQWRRENQSWRDPPVIKECKWECSSELDPRDLIQGERYEARVRVQYIQYLSAWSDWSPVASWESSIGKTKSPPSDFAGGVLGTVTCVVTIVIAMLLILFRTDKTTWIYIVKRIRGPPLPNPANSFLQDANFQSWLSPHFISESCHAFLKPVEIVSVEVTSTVDVVAPNMLQATLPEKKRGESSYESTSSSFSNPSYSQVSPPPAPPPPPPPFPVLSLTAGNLKPCDADTPYGPVGRQDEGNNPERDRDEVRGKEVEIQQLLSKCNNSEPMPVISDYEKVEKPQVERFRLQSLDSGMGSGEEVSQESLEADSISVTDCKDEGPEGMEQRKGGNTKEIDFQRLLGGSRGVFDKGSIQVCSDYERVPMLQADSFELPSLDSGISSGGEEQVSQEESQDDVDKSSESTSLLFPPPLLSSALPCSLPSLTPLPLNFQGAGFSLALRPLPSHILDRIALMSANKSVEPSSDGYTPVRQEQS